MAGAVVATGSASAATERSGITFDRVVNAVDDLGMDPTGSRAIDSALDSAHRTGTLIEFPPGDYLVTQQHVWDDGVSRFGVVGTGNSHKDVQFVFPSQSPGEGVYFIVSRDGSHYLLSNFSIQQTADEYTSATIWLAHDDGTLIQDVEWLGRVPADDHTNYNLLAFACVTRDGVCTARRVYMREGSVMTAYPGGTAGIMVPGATTGEVRLEDCHIEQMNSSSFRASNLSGVLRVEGGLFRNNDVTNMRISGGNHPSKESYIKGATMVIDADDLRAKYTSAADELHYPNGLTIESHGDNQTAHSGLLIEDCDFIQRSSPGSRGVIELPEYGGHGAFTLRNCRILNETTTQTVNIAPPDRSRTQEPWGITIENTSITATASSQPSDAVVDIGSYRDGSSVRNSCIHASNGDIDGIAFQDSSNCSVEETNINVTGQPVRVSGGSVSTSSLSYDQSCPLPSTDSSSPSNDGPAADISVTGTDGLTVDLSAADSSDSDGQIVAYDWDVDGTAYAGETVSHTFSDAGTYPVSLTVEDDDGATATATSEVTVDTASDLPNTLELRGTGTATNYEFTVSGDLAEANDSLQSWDDLSGSTASGWVSSTENVDTYAFGGDVTSFEFLQGEADVYLNGSQVDPNTLGADAPEERTIELRGTGTATNYEFTVSGDLAEANDSLQSWDDISGSSASGWVSSTSNVDTYRFTGEITDFAFAQGEADVYVDGEQVDLGEPTTHTLELRGTGTATNYEFTVSGDLAEANDSLQSWDDISGSTASGWVSSTENVDAFEFTGEITDFAFAQGEADVYVDGERVDPSTL